MFKRYIKIFKSTDALKLFMLDSLLVSFQEKFCHKLSLIVSL